jgi:glycosyltransferase involved in cell wall biosynthesis
MLNILCIVQTPVPSTEISIIRPFSYLEQQREINWQLIKEAAFRPDLLHEVDVAVFHRNCHPNSLSILHAVKTAQIPAIYEIDDNFFELPEVLPIGRYMRNPRIVQTMEFFLRSADKVKVGSPELIPFVSQYTQNVIYQPYAVDLTLINHIRPREKDCFTIGYAGTIHHSPDLKFIIDPIRRIAEENPQIHWEFIGCRPEFMEDIPNHSFTPFIPQYTAFLQELYRRNWQIGLSPILDLPHNRCKTDNKLREYSACRIPGIFSNIPPYSANIQHGKTGLLAENTGKAWLDAMKILINDESLRSKIAVQARKWVEEERSIPVIGQLWIELFHQLTKK